MMHRVVRKQENSKMCLVCGLKNPQGLHAAFYELENNELVAVIHPRNEHQSYPGRLHGGATMALLDETIGRAVMMRQDGMIWGVTIDFQAKFRKPVPLGVELRVVGRITNDLGRMFEGTGELLLPDGDAAVTAYGKYMKMPLARIADFDAHEQEWRVVPHPADPTAIELPNFTG